MKRNILEQKEENIVEKIGKWKLERKKVKQIQKRVNCKRLKKDVEWEEENNR